MSNTRPVGYPGAPLDEGKNEIRLLKLYPGIEHESIHCSLHNANIDAIATADALSYAWAEPPATHQVWINDFEFHVRTNLYHALQNLRLPSETRILWIDALCIDQSNVVERNHQVQQMAQVFGSARSVIVWLGLSTESISQAFAFLKEMYVRGHAARKAAMSDPRWHTITELCLNQYWHRVWIVQEICLGKNVVVAAGHFRIPWQYITELRKARKHVWPQYQSDGERAFMRSLTAKIDQQKELRSSRGCVLWTLMETFKDSLCQEYHDKVYGFLGLSTDCSAETLVVDYTRTVQELHEDVLNLYRQKSDRSEQWLHNPQLFALSESQHTLLNDHYRPEEHRRKTHEDGATALQLCKGLPKSFLVSAEEVWSISSFPVEFDDDENGLSLVRDFLDGRAPYSHLGHWRNQFDPSLGLVRTFDDIEASIIFSTSRRDLAKQDISSVPIDRPKVFSARRRISWANDKAQTLYGIAPAGTEIEDFVVRFVESNTALLFNKCSTHQRSKNGAQISLPAVPARNTIGRALILQPLKEAGKDARAMHLSRDKIVEITQHLIPRVDQSFKVLARDEVHITTRALRLLTTPGAQPRPDRRVFAREALELMPEVTTARSAASEVRDGVRRGRELDLEDMVRDLRLYQYTLGPGYAPVANPGALGYMCCMLQLFFFLAPIRNVSSRK